MTQPTSSQRDIMDKETIVTVEGGGMGYDPLRDAIRSAVASATMGIHPRDVPRVRVRIHGADNAAYDDEEGLGLLVLSLDIEAAVRQALKDGGFATVRDAYGNTVGNIVIEEVTP